MNIEKNVDIDTWAEYDATLAVTAHRLCIACVLSIDGLEGIQMVAAAERLVPIAESLQTIAMRAKANAEQYGKKIDMSLLPKEPTGFQMPWQKEYGTDREGGGQ